MLFKQSDVTGTVEIGLIALDFVIDVGDVNRQNHIICNHF